MLKGSTTIELTDVNTGEVEVIKDDNMVTKAIADFFSHNIDGTLFTMAGGTTELNGNMIPICPNAIGGILLFSDVLEEDEDIYYAPSANPCVGYASNDVNSSANAMRGSLNLTESMELDHGYKFVWDFTTSQANGTISAVALTHKWGGIAYMGDEYNNTSRVWSMKTVSIINDEDVRTGYINAVEIDFEGNFFYSISLDTSNQLIIQKIRKSFRMLGLNDTLLEDKLDIMEEHILTPTVFIMPNPASNSGNYDFFDGRDGYWYGFWHDANNTGSAVIKWIKIKKSDYSFSEGTWTIENAQLQPVGAHSGYNTAPSRLAQSVLRNGYLYMVSFDKTAVYKINIENPTDVTRIDLGFTTSFASSGIASSTSQMILVGDWVICSDFRLDTEDRVYKTQNAMPFATCGTPIFQYGPYVFCYGGLNVYFRKHLFLHAPYLATINNLPTSVIKTADKTMKITYIIQEK